jgi:hypothetical protein
MNESLTLREGSRISIGSSRKRWTVTKLINKEIKVDTGGLHVWFILNAKEMRKRKKKPPRNWSFSFWLSDIDIQQVPRFKRKKAVFWIHGVKKKIRLSIYQHSDITSFAA